jgi:hypothetical protein
MVLHSLGCLHLDVCAGNRNPRNYWPAYREWRDRGALSDDVDAMLALVGGVVLRDGEAQAVAPADALPEPRSAFRAMRPAYVR